MSKNSNESPREPYDKQARTYLLTLNNPLEHNYTHEIITDIIHNRFKNIIFWCMCDEIGNQTGTYHTHIYILLEKKKRWSAVQRAFQHAHIDLVKGSPQQAVDYIKKTGKWKGTDKSETNLPDTYYEEGKLPVYYPSENRKELLETIQQMIDDGMRPEQIFSKSILYRQVESIVRKQFYMKRFQDTPPIRDVEVVYHLGISGSGKSYAYVKLCEEYGADEVYFASDFANRCTALLDTYDAQRILFIDEIKTDSFQYGYLLQLLQGYRTPIHARYSNVFSLWDQVHLTSIFTPHELYEGMVDPNNRSVDSEYQLLRRISAYMYHWKDDAGFHELILSADKVHGKERSLFQYFRELTKGVPVNDPDPNENPFSE